MMFKRWGIKFQPSLSNPRKLKKSLMFWTIISLNCSITRSRSSSPSRSIQLRNQNRRSTRNEWDRKQTKRKIGLQISTENQTRPIPQIIPSKSRWASFEITYTHPLFSEATILQRRSITQVAGPIERVSGSSQTDDYCSPAQTNARRRSGLSKSKNKLITFKLI